MFPLSDDNPREGPAIVTWSLVAACVLVFLWQLSLGEGGEVAIYGFGMIPARLFGDAELPAAIPTVVPTECTAQRKLLRAPSRRSSE